MKSAAVLCLLLALSGVHAEHPIKGVINLIDGLMAKAEAEHKEEEIAFDKFKHWCRNSEKAVSKAIAEGKETIASLEDTIASKKAEINTLTEEIAGLADQILNSEKAQARADKIREDQKKNYDGASEDLKSTIEAMDGALAALQDAKGKVSLVQLTAPVRRALELAQMLVPEKTGMAISALIQQQDHPEVEAKGDYGAHVDKYKFKGGDVIEMLKQLKAQFEDDLLETEKEETNSINSHALAKEARDNALDAAKASKKEKEGLRSDAEGALGEAESDLKDQQQDLEADSATLAETQKSCTVETAEWGERSATRKLELEAMTKAIEILSKQTGVRTESSQNPVPPPSPVSFLQVQGSDPRAKAVTLLRAKAKVLHSRALEQMAQAVAAHLTGPTSERGHFDEVNNMIQKMIFRLMAEQKDEDDHKNWCDQELEKTETSKADKEAKIEELSTKIEAANAKISQLSKAIEEATKMVAAIDAHVEEATEIRKIGKEQNAISRKDAQDAQTAIASASAVLTEFYKKSGMMETKPWEFLQAPVELPENPGTWDAGYTGVADPTKGDGILSVLAEVGEDFAKMEAETEAQEANDQGNFEQDMKGCKIEKARRLKENAMKEAEKARLNDKVETLSKQKKHVEDEHFATSQYLKDLEPACVSGDSTYEDRKAARTQEIEALRQAQGILTDAFKQKTFLQMRRH